MNNKLLCIYHHNCQDGFGAAWAVWKRFKDEVEFHPGIHGEEPPDVLGRHVIIVDFSYKAPVIRDMAKRAASILVLDHHKSAEAELAEFAEAAATWEEHLQQPAGDGVGVQFDMNRSGAVMAWNYFHPGRQLPDLLKYVQDRDLWRFEHSRTKMISAVVFSFPYQFTVWDGLAQQCEDSYWLARLFDTGTGIVRQHDKDVAELIPVTKRPMVIGGFKVPVANMPYMFASDAGHIMSEGEPFAATYYDGATHRHFSLRSAKDGFDVSEIAKQYGGGGHKHAAGFRMPIGWEGDMDFLAEPMEIS